MPAAPVSYIVDQSSLDHAVDHLRQCDGDCIDQMIEFAGPPPLRKREAGLAGLIRIIISQQVSTASADAIHNRFVAQFGTFTASDLRAVTEADFKLCGLSAPKIRTLRHLSDAIHNGTLNLEAMQEMDSTAVHQALTAVKGIGPWTADVYLLFCLGHPDVWPAGDLALQEGARMALNLRKRPDAARLEKISKRWQPWRAAAARIIWAYYGAARSVTRTTDKPIRKPARKPAKKSLGRPQKPPARAK